MDRECTQYFQKNFEKNSLMLYSEHVSLCNLAPPGTYFQGEELSFWGEDLKGGGPTISGGDLFLGSRVRPKNNTYAIPPLAPS